MNSLLMYFLKKYNADKYGNAHGRVNVKKIEQRIGYRVGLVFQNTTSCHKTKKRKIVLVPSFVNLRDSHTLATN